MSQLALALIRQAKQEGWKSLDLGRTGLRDDNIPDELFDLVELEELRFSNFFYNIEKDEPAQTQNEGEKNCLKRLPLNIIELINLKKLYAGGGGFPRWEISDISILENLHKLEYLYLNDNNISNIKPLKNLKLLRFLNISNNREIKDFRVLKDLKRLEYLNISYNNIFDIKVLKNLKKILYLDLSDNKQIKDFSTVTHLTTLKHLNIHYNEIMDISFVKNLKNLNYLNIGENFFYDVSPIENLDKLEFIDLSCNEFIDDASFLRKLKNIKSLNLSSTNISDISDLEILHKIRFLDLSESDVSDIKPLLPLIHKDVPVKLEYDSEDGDGIYLDHCPITTPPLETVAKGNAAILRYFDELKDKGVDYLNEGKLLLVGEGGVGKTSLCRKLEKDDAALPEEEERTRGIDVLRLPIAGKDDAPFYMNIWDFGGQDIYHATHRFFLTRRSLYVLLTETRRQDDNFDYWIPNIHLFGGGSPILVVNNKRDGFPRQVSIGAFRKNEAFNIQGTVHEINLKNGEGVARLKSDICHHIQQLPLVGNPVPKTWVQVREALNELSQSTAHITYQDFEDICRDKGIDEVLKIEDLGKYLHDLGVVLWYHDIGALKHRVILQPTWATDAVYLIIDDTTIQESYGHFDGSDIARIWAAPAYARMHSELLALMQAFRLCYQKTRSEAYIIPSMLRPDADFVWEERDNVRLYYEYEFMPKGLVNQLTAELHRLIPDDNQVWSRGVVLERDGTQVKVEEIRKDKRLTFHAKGLMPGALLQEVAGRLEDVHLGYPGIQVEKVVPCPCVDCKDSDEPTLFYYKKLIKWLQRGNNPITCNESQEKIHIEKILGHVGIDTSMIMYKRLHLAPSLPTSIPKEPPTSSNKQLNVFISYSKEDKILRDKLDKFLTPLKRNGSIETWHDRDLLAGDDWDKTIKAKLHEADIVLCLVSSDFLATDYIMDVELPIMLELEKVGTKIIPAILRPCMWKQTELAKFHFLSEKGTPLTLADNEDAALEFMCEQLVRVIEAT